MGRSIGIANNARKNLNWLCWFPNSLRNWTQKPLHKSGGVSMDLLDKFDAVTILADARISQADKNYCETQQKAYEAAISSYKELAFFWEDIVLN